MWFHIFRRLDTVEAFAQDDLTGPRAALADALKWAVALFRFALVVIFGCLAIGAARADLLRTGTSRWLVVASTQDLDDAIGIASAYQARFEDVRVVEASNGWLAIIAGPVPIEGGIKATLKSLRAGGGYPADAFLSDGQRFSRTVWIPPAAIPLLTWKYDEQSALNFDLEGYRIAVSDQAKEGSDERNPVISVSRAGQPLIREALTEVGLAPDSMNAEVRAVVLDKSAAKPQLVFSSFWMGAHCCTVTTFLVPTDSGWISVSGRTLDADGYQFNDVDGDGAAELISADNSFLYAFAPYASSWAPIVIEKMMGGRIVDMRWQPEFRRYYRRELARWEHQASIYPDLWRDNGFLGPWVALKALLGELDDGWQRMLANYDRSGSWPLSECTAPNADGTCPSGSERQITFPEALRGHLERTGYVPGFQPPAQAVKEPEAPETIAAKPDAEPKISQASSGTGFIVSKQGHVVTNNHVVKACSQFEVRRPGKPPSPANLVAADATNDLALLQLTEAPSSVARVRLDVRLGESVAVFGYPLTQVLSSSGNFTLGNVTALSGIGDDSRFLQISAPVQQGNSGGPLLDEYGNVVGVVTAKLDALASLVVTGDIPQNVNFAIRSSSLFAFLLAHGVQPEAASTDRELDAPDLAEYAATVSAAIVCQ